jgi:hypothetical protein
MFAQQESGGRKPPISVIRQRCNADRSELDRASDRRVAVEPHVRAVLVVVGGVLADQAQEMTLTEYNQVIEQLSTKGGQRIRRTALP